MSTMLERMRARVNERQPNRGGDNSIYPFWNLKFGASSTMRFLPYNDPITGAFWAERVLLPMQFTDPEDETKLVKFLAPCREMYVHNEKCPILGPVRDLYAEEKELRNSGATKDADKLKKIAGAHWKKPTFYYQGFVVKSGMTEEDGEPENPIRVFPMNKMVHKMIFSSIFEAEEDPFEILPTGEFTEDDVQAILGDGAVDMEIFKGFNFVMKKAKRGEWADWTTESNWSRSMTALEDEHLAAIAEHGFWDLTKRLPDRPSDEQYDLLTEMMNVSIQRQLTGENGVWQKEWEEAGFKPVKPRGDGSKPTTGKSDGDDEGESKPKAASGSTKSSSDALARLKASRAKQEDAPAPASEPEAEAEETPADVAAAADSVEESAPAETGVSDLAAKIKARVGKS